MLDAMIAKIKEKAVNNMETCEPPLVFGNADPFAALAALAASSGQGNYPCPHGLDKTLADDTLIMYYLDWHKSAVTGRIGNATLPPTGTRVA